MMKMTYAAKSTLWIVVVLCMASFGAAAHGAIQPNAGLILFGLCFACELIDSALGMGYGTILTPSMLFMGYQPQDIVPTILVSELFSGFAAAFFHNEIKNVELGFHGRDFKPATILAVGSVLGVASGFFTSVHLPANVLKMAIGCVILMSGLFVILMSQHVFVYKNWKMFILAGLASFNKTLSGGGYGPLVTSGQILSGVEGKSAVGITSYAEAFTCLVAATLFLVQGGVINLNVFIPMGAGALISVPFSVVAIKKSHENHLKIVIGLLTMLMGGFTIYKSLHM
jgi:uncharacterized membrane protein YfcA